MPARTAPRKWTRRTDRHVLDVLERRAHSDPRHHRRRAGAQPALPPARRRRARDLGVHVIDRCNLTILDSPGQEDLAEFLADEPGRDRRLDALLPAGQCRQAARQGRLRRLDPRRSSASTRSATAATARSISISSTIRRDLRCRRRRPARNRLQARSGRALRHRVQSPVHARQHADPALRLDSDLQGRVRPLSRLLRTRTATKISTA